MIDTQYTEYNLMIMIAGFASVFQARKTAQKAPNAEAWLIRESEKMMELNYAKQCMDAC